MAIEVHVQGRIATGELSSFAEAVERYKDYAGAHGYAVPQVLQGLSGAMNTVRLVYRYADAAEYEVHEAKTLQDRDYAKVAEDMSLVDGTVEYEIYRQV